MQHRNSAERGGPIEAMQCSECNTEMIFGTHPIETRVGRHVVVSRTVPHDRCPSCGYFELDAKVGELLELRAAQVVMHEVQDLDPAALKFARKALGLNQTALASKLGLTQETISRYETGAFPVGTEYRYALAGLLSYEEQVLCGADMGHVRSEVAA